MTDVPDTPNPNLIAWAGGNRATLAITFTDVVKSTQLANRLRDEAMRDVRRAHFDTSDGLIVKYGGRRIKGLGDGHMAVFRAAENATIPSLFMPARATHKSRFAPAFTLVPSMWNRTTFSAVR